MTRTSSFCSALLAMALLTTAWGAAAAVFTVNSLGDFSDDDVGDGLCETVRGNIIDGFRLECSLRGAVEQANALAGADVIEFSVAGRIILSAGLGPLDRIVETLTIDGSTAPGAPGRDSFTSLAPVVILDGRNLSDVDEDSGLVVDRGASGSEIINLAVVDFPRDGIFVFSENASWITGNWLGVDPETGLANSNRNGLGIGSGTNGIIVGRTLPGDGRGNVMSGNRNLGLRSETSFGLIRGNRVGVDAEGQNSIPNLIGGASFPFGSSNDIGELTTVESHRNVFTGNLGTNLTVTGADNLIRGNLIGCSLGPVIVNQAQGLRVFGDNTTVGGSAEAANLFCDHENRTALFALTVMGLTVSHNSIFGGGTSILVENSVDPAITDNTINAADSVGISVEDTTGATVLRNTVSASNIGFSLTNASNNRVEGNQSDFNAVGLRVRSSSDGNVVTLNTVTNNLVGVQISSSADNQISENVISSNQGAGITVSLNDSTGNRISENEMADNDTLGIDLNDDGMTENDANDDDNGPNRLQNAPEVTITSFFPGLKGGAGGPEIELTYVVDSTITASAYPMDVELFLASPSTPDQGQTFLVSLNYNTPQNPASLAVTLPDGTVGGWIVATATDSNGNTSEFSAPANFGPPDALFSDSFEAAPMAKHRR